MRDRVDFCGQAAGDASEFVRRSIRDNKLGNLPKHEEFAELLSQVEKVIVANGIWITTDSLIHDAV